MAGHSRITLTRDAEEFSARAERFLAERLERNVLATVLMNARRGDVGAVRPLFAYVQGADGEVRAAALRMPPWPLLTSELDTALAGELIERWMAQDPNIPGISADPATARAVGAAWRRRTGGQTACRMREAMHLLTEVSDPPLPAPGRLRQATGAERELLVAWEEAFAVEAGLAESSEAPRSVARRLASGGQFVWEDGEPVATLTMSPPVAGTLRIGPVYTPPEHRRHGYASSAVAAASRRALAGVARQCMLFTDLANPTSNRIYATVGFRRYADWEELTFLPA
jgi:RimJ/RimL family protein N-acetyltransferase